MFIKKFSKLSHPNQTTTSPRRMVQVHILSFVGYFISFYLLVLMRAYMTNMQLFLSSG
uniref:Uncharacterized protein n=1 Tax=Rhizophora mucronata TaxID=61149 RepID=A0A2P2J6B4_RHIMU